MPAGVRGFISLSAQAENFTMTEGHYFTSKGYTSQSVFSAKSVLSAGINPSSRMKSLRRVKSLRMWGIYFLSLSAQVGNRSSFDQRRADQFADAVKRLMRYLIQQQIHTPAPDLTEMNRDRAERRP